MKTVLSRCLIALFAALCGAQVFAHHSFAPYDMETEIEFEGVVETLRLRNPHMSMTLRETRDGEERIINFIEGAPANMLVRLGVDPASIQPGKRIKAIGSPLKEDPNSFFLKTIILEDGTRYDTMSRGQTR